MWSDQSRKLATFILIGNMLYDIEIIYHSHYGILEQIKFRRRLTARTCQRFTQADCEVVGSLDLGISRSGDLYADLYIE